MSVRMHLHQYMGADAAGGYALFFSPGTSTAKTTYQSDYSTAASLNAAGGVAITTDGWLDTYLLGDYDMTVKSRTGATLSSASATGINPQEADVEAQGGNLLSNGSFEADTNGDSVPDNWTLTSFSGSTNVLDSSDQQHGAKSMSFTSTGSGGGFIVSDEFMACSPGRDVKISFLLKSTAAVRNLVEVIWYTSGQVEISDTDIYDNATTNPTSWAVRGGIATPPSTARYMKLRIYGCHSSDATPGTARYDDVNVYQQVLAPASGFISGAETQLNINGGNSTLFAADSVITESTFESVGRTGSSATNIWTALDSIPAGARVAIVGIFMDAVTNSADTVCTMLAYARQTGSSEAVSNITSVAKLQSSIDDAVGQAETILVMAKFPLNDEGSFDFTWTVTNDGGGRDVDLILKGFEY